MGENLAGFDSVETMVAAIVESEDAQLAAMGDFLSATKLNAALRAHDWTTFARGYNGPDFSINRYDIRLNGEFQKLSVGALPDLHVRAAQLYLTYHGFHPGPIDGVAGEQTLSALAQFQVENELPQTVTIDGEMIAHRLRRLKTDFVVVYQPSKDEPQYEFKKDAAGAAVLGNNKAPVPDPTKPLYDVTYYTKRSKDADDFAKQIFTTLATIFVSVISFYFGSSATSSGVGAGAKAAKDGGDGSKKNDPQAALAETKVAAHDAQAAADRAVTVAKNADELASKAQGDKAKALEASANKAKTATSTAMQAANDAKQRVEEAQKAVTDAAAAGNDATKASAASTAAFKARDAARTAADTAKQSANEAERILKDMSSTT